MIFAQPSFKAWGWAVVVESVATIIWWDQRNSLNRRKENPFKQKENILRIINGTYARIVFLFNVIELKHV